MKKITFLISVILLSILIACKKDNQNNGSILAKVQFNNQYVAYATIELFTDTTHTPVATKRADAIGEAYFSDLMPGNYYLSANGQLYNQDTDICGKTMVQVLYRGRANHYNVIIDTKPCK